MRHPSRLDRPYARTPHADATCWPAAQWTVLILLGLAGLVSLFGGFDAVVIAQR